MTTVLLLYAEQQRQDIPSHYASDFLKAIRSQSFLYLIQCLRSLPRFSPKYKDSHLLAKRKMIHFPSFANYDSNKDGDGNSNMNNKSRLWKKAILVLPLLFALWILVDDESTTDTVTGSTDASPPSDSYHQEFQHPRHHLALYTALSRHPPSLRVFRSLLEIDLLLWCVAFSLYVWSHSNVGTRVVGYLLFRSSSTSTSGGSHGDGNQVEHDGHLTANLRDGYPGRYEPVLTVEADELWIDSSVKPTTTTGDGDENNEKDTDGSDKEEKATHANNRPSRFGESDKEDRQEETSDGIIDDDDDDDTDLGSDPMQLIEDMFEIPEPPSSISVANVAVDLLLLILTCLFLFTLSSAEGGTYIDGMQHTTSLFRFIAMIVAPIFPLLLFATVCIHAVYPWTKSKRKEFWTIISYTVSAPIYHVTFRDGFVGDILTSSVRPMQDIAYTMFYLSSGLKGWWSQSYDLDHADLPLESNWYLHTWILPMCMISPLWWRFLQNLRQCYEHKKRWPYLGNAFKYFVAAEVAMFGIFNPTKKETVGWLSCFVIATLYQVWWDVFMDWELFQLDYRSGLRIKLRSTRIYQHEWMYWMIFGINFVLRFGWTLSFLPPHYLNKAGVLSATFKGDISAELSPMIASAEIIRRTLWGLLRLELEAIKVARNDERLQGAWKDDAYKACGDNLEQGGDVELQPMMMRQELEPVKYTELVSSGVWLSNDMSMLSDLQILGELCLYSTAFTGLGMVAAAHRMTL